MSRETVTIVDCRASQPIDAVLYTKLEGLQLLDIEIEWSQQRLQLLRRIVAEGSPAPRLPEHIHWNWAMKALNLLDLLSFRAVGIEAQGKMQGLMLLCFTRSHAQLDPERGKPIVYVDYVETAPWNAKEFTMSPQFKGVGLRLMQAAVRVSIEEGFSGRVGLHSLPQSVPFYTSTCGMRSLGIDTIYQNLEYFELSAVQARELLNKE